MSVEERVRFWQKLLRVLDWRVEYRFVHGEDMHQDADIIVTQKLLSGKIRFVERLRPGEGEGVSEELDGLICHELCHILFAPFETANDTPLGIAEEQAIERMANALTGLERQVRAARGEAVEAREAP